MLPLKYFERMTGCKGLRVDGRGRERRLDTGRVCVHSQALAFVIANGVISVGQILRMRECSRSGASAIARVPVRVGQEFVLMVSGRDGIRHTLWSTWRRSRFVDGICVVGISFNRLLLPGQRIDRGTLLEDLAWLDVEGDANPADLDTSDFAA